MNSSELLYNALAEIAKKSSDYWAAELAEAAITEYQLREQNLSFLFNFHESKLLQRILENPVPANASSEKASAAWADYSKVCRVEKDGLLLPTDARTAKEVNPALWEKASQKDRIDWSLVKRWEEIESIPRIHKKTRCQHLWSWAKFLSDNRI